MKSEEAMQEIAAVLDRNNELEEENRYLRGALNREGSLADNAISGIKELQNDNTLLRHEIHDLKNATFIIDGRRVAKIDTTPDNFWYVFGQNDDTIKELQRELDECREQCSELSLDNTSMRATIDDREQLVKDMYNVMMQNNDNLEHELDNRKQHIDRVYKQLHENDLTLAAYRTQNIDQHNTIEELENKISTFDLERAELKHRQICMNEECARLENIINKLEKDRDEWRQSSRAAGHVIRRQSSRIEELESRIAARKGQTDYLEIEIANRIRRIDELKNVINAHKAKLADRERQFNELDGTLERTRNAMLCANKYIGKQNVQIEGLEAELSARKEDSEVLMKVVELVKAWREDHNAKYMHRMDDVVKNYIDVPKQQTNMIIRVPMQKESIGSKLDKIRELILFGEISLDKNPNDAGVKERLYRLRKRERKLRTSLDKNDDRQ